MFSFQLINQKNIHVMEEDNYYRYLKENIEVRKITDLF